MHFTKIFINQFAFNKDKKKNINNISLTRSLQPWFI